MDRQPQLERARRNAQIFLAAERLRGDHECDHDDWGTVSTGSLRSELCTYTLGDFLLECRQCDLRACVRCKRNRLQTVEYRGYIVADMMIAYLFEIA